MYDSEKEDKLIANLDSTNGLARMLHNLCINLIGNIKIVNMNIIRMSEKKTARLAVTARVRARPLGGLLRGRGSWAVRFGHFLGSM